MDTHRLDEQTAEQERDQALVGEVAGDASASYGLS